MGCPYLQFRNLSENKKSSLTSRHRPGSNKCHRSAQLLPSPPEGASWVGQIGRGQGQRGGGGGEGGGSGRGGGARVGDQRRSKSRGCQKEQEEDEEEEVCGRAYTEWVWPLLTVHPGEGGKEGGRKEKQGWGRGRWREVQEVRKGGGAKKKGAKDRWDEEIRNGKDVEETRRKKRKKKSGKEDHRQEEKAAEHLKSLVSNHHISIR